MGQLAWGTIFLVAHTILNFVDLYLLGYDAMGYELSKPNLRAEMEADLVRHVLLQYSSYVVYPI